MSLLRENAVLALFVCLALGYLAGPRQTMLGAVGGKELAPHEMAALPRLVGRTFQVHAGSANLSLGTCGGCLIVGLIFGWLRAQRPVFGA